MTTLEQPALATDTGTLEHWDTGTLEHWDTGTLGHWDTGTLGNANLAGIGTQTPPSELAPPQELALWPSSQTQATLTDRQIRELQNRLYNHKFDGSYETTDWMSVRNLQNRLRPLINPFRTETGPFYRLNGMLEPHLAIAILFANSKEWVSCNFIVNVINGEVSYAGAIGGDGTSRDLGLLSGDARNAGIPDSLTNFNLPQRNICIPLTPRQVTDFIDLLKL